MALVNYEQDGGVVTLTLNRPEKLNAFSDELVGALGEALPYAERRFDAVTVAGAFTPGHAPASSLADLVRLVRPGGYLVFSLRDDVAQPDFTAAIADLTRAGAWTLLHTGAPFQSLPKVEPHVRNRLYVYSVN